MQKTKEREKKEKEQPKFNNVPENELVNAENALREKLIIGGPQMGQPGMGMGQPIGMPMVWVWYSQWDNHLEWQMNQV